MMDPKEKNQTAQDRGIIFNGTVGEEVEEEKEATNVTKKKGRRHKIPD